VRRKRRTVSMDVAQDLAGKREGRMGKGRTVGR